MALPWLSVESLAQILQEKVPSLNASNIKCFEVHKNEELGKRSCCNISNVLVHLQSASSCFQNEIRLVIKSLANHNKECVKELGIQTKEDSMHFSVLPEMNKYLTNDSFTFFAFRAPELDTIIFEDPTGTGYGPICDPEWGDVSQILCVIRKLAKFHAASVAVHQKNPRLIEETGAEILYSSSHNMFCSAVENAINAVSIRLQFWTDVENREEYEGMLRTLKKTLWVSAVNARNSSSCGLKVLNFSSLRIPHIYMKSDESGGNGTVKFTDFHFCSYASPVLDLLAFLPANVSFDVYNQHLPEFLHEYLTVLNSSLAEFGTGQTVSHDSFMEDFQRSQIIGVLAVLILRILIVGETTKTALFEPNGKVSSSINSVLDSKHYRFTALKFLDYFKKRNVF